MCVLCASVHHLRGFWLSNTTIGCTYRLLCFTSHNYTQPHSMQWQAAHGIYLDLYCNYAYSILRRDVCFTATLWAVCPPPLPAARSSWRAAARGW